MNLDRLRVFVAVADEGSTTAAAERVHLSQPAVSRNLKRLEDELDVELFHRTSTGLELTSSGRALLAEAREILDAVSRAKHTARGAAERDYFDVRIGTVDSIASYLLPQAIEPLREQFPELEIKIFSDRTRLLLERIEDGRLDIALVAYSGPPAEERVARIGRYNLQFYGCKKRFPGLNEVTTDEELTQYPVVQLNPENGQPSLVDDNTPSFALADSLATVKSLVMAGFGVGSLLQFMLTDTERNEQLVRARVPHDPDCHVYAHWAEHWRGETERAIRKRLVDALRAQFQ